MTYTRNTTLILATIAASGLLGGCNNSTDPSASNATQSDIEDHSGHDHAQMGGDQATPHSYTGIRGQIAQLPDANDPSSALKIHHEQIPGFMTKDGTVSVNTKGIAGMPSMTMPFPVGSGVSLDGLSVGDIISFDFMVNWGSDRPAWEVTRIEKLEPGTELDFTNKVQEILEQGKEDAEDAMENMKDMGEDMMDHSGHDHPMGNDGP